MVVLVCFGDDGGSSNSGSSSSQVSECRKSRSMVVG